MLKAPSLTEWGFLVFSNIRLFSNKFGSLINFTYICLNKTKINMENKKLKVGNTGRIFEEINVDNFQQIDEEMLFTDPENIIKSNGEEVSYEVFFDDETNRFVCTKLDPANRFPDAPDVLYYTLDKAPEDLTGDEVDRVLTYSLGSDWDVNEELPKLEDVIMQGEFVTLTSYVKDGVEFCIVNPDSL